jgi:hypothetical protein
MRTYRDWSPAVALMLAVTFAPSAHGDDVMRRRVVGSDIVELQVLATQPFFSEKDVTTKHITDGREIEGGSDPVMPDADSKPNHQLVLEVLDRNTGQVVSNARVTMKFGPVDDTGRPIGAQVQVPVVVTQAIGQGPTSTRYGNNVTMPDGLYHIIVTVNAEPTIFGFKAD